MLVTKTFTFDMAHRLTEHKAKCWNIHGHTYKLEVTLMGKLKANGMVIDYTDLKNVVNEFIDENLDHKYLSNSADEEVIKFMQKSKFALTVVDFEPTAENMVEWIFDELKDKFGAGVQVYAIKLWETPTSSAEKVLY